MDLHIETDDTEERNGYLYIEGYGNITKFLSYIETCSKKAFIEYLETVRRENESK